MSGLKSIAATLENAVGDLSSLEVTTYTGDIELVSQGGKIQWDQIPTQAEANVKVHLTLATKINIDGDAMHFVSSAEIPKYVLDTHAEAVRNGSEYRTQIINFLAGKVAGLLT